MKSFRQGILIGLILSALLTVALALTLNDERRRRLRYYFEKFQNSLPGGVEQLKQSAQDAANRARETGNNLGEHVQESAGKLVQHTQEILSTAQKKAAFLSEKQETNDVI